jgi:hypothetical protein
MSNRFDVTHPALALCFGEHAHPAAERIVPDHALGSGGLVKVPDTQQWRWRDEEGLCYLAPSCAPAMDYRRPWPEPGSRV